VEGVSGVPDVASLDADTTGFLVTLLRLEFVGPQQLYVVAHVDLTGDAGEPELAVRLRDLEARVSSSPAVVATTLGLSAPDEPSLQP
jgi:hypothetical protein